MCERERGKRESERGKRERERAGEREREREREARERARAQERERERERQEREAIVCVCERERRTHFFLELLAALVIFSYFISVCPGKLLFYFGNEVLSQGVERFVLGAFPCTTGFSHSM